ncbi:MAG: acetyl-CoA carboxylase biotin carboxylase subunit [Nitrospirae bacterium]|nr:MAG: acetyl-CoA carboxylase biotin carboxylase subunit [Nitrospirota bacterium]
MLKRVLIANRGEVALRIIRACKELGIRTLAIHSREDSAALYVKKADRAVIVGPGPIKGYLNIYPIIEIAKQFHCDAIHPGYGFLAENPDFARACEENGITFVGPPSQAIAMMGDKITARRLMQEAGVPVAPGTEGAVDVEGALAFAREVGYPVMLKASAGGGGRGLRAVYSEAELRDAFATASSEAQAAFGSGEMFVEKLIERPHHIEFQILADRYGNVVHLGERDCSIQRRHQKLVEIAPSLFLDAELRERMGEAAVAAAKACGYVNAGTVEFLVDKERNFYFMEMNTRLQVEHTVTEVVTGIDIVREQLKIAAGKPLSFSQKEVELRGHAIEVRVNAEDPRNDFVPTPGKITAYYSPGGIGVRIDGNAYPGYTIPMYYDSMIAKMTVYGRTWQEATSRLARCLDEFIVRGVKTTLPLYKQIVRDEFFRRGRFDTGYLEEREPYLRYEEERDPTDLVRAISAAIVAHHGL